MKDPEKAAFAHRMCAIQGNNYQKNGNLSTCCQAVNYLLAIYAIENVIAETAADITNCKQPEHMSDIRCSEVLRGKALRCGRVYEKKV